jgi:exodeoxyribonuclease V beta subunit
MSFDVLSRHVNINTQLLIEASAGTGKTFTIEHLFIRRLLEKRKDGRIVNPADIAVVTFTRAVARELSFRIRRALKTAIHQLSTDVEDAPDYIVAIKEQGKEKEAKMQLLEAYASFDSAQITTIHGFCNRMLSEYHQVEEAKLISSDELLHLVDDFFRRELVDEPIEVKQLTKLLQAHKNDYALLRQEIVEKLWAEDDVPIAITEMPYYGSGLQEDLETLTIQFTGCCTKDGIIKSDLAKGIQALSSGNILQIIAFPLYASDWFVKPKVKASPNAEILSYLQKLEPWIRELADPDRILRRFCTRILAFVRTYMQKHALFSQEELVHSMAISVDDIEFKDFLQKRFSCLIVDEFQDTDPLQWKILKTVFLDRGSLFLVGDPKQAIYAFRKADVYSYIEAKKVLGADKGQLVTNYRSSTNLVSALNSLFAGPESHKLFLLPKLSDSIEPPPLLAGAMVDELADGKAPVVFLEAHGSLGRGRAWPNDDVESQFLTYITDELKTLFMYGVEKKSCAILVKDRHQALRVETALKYAGIALVANTKKTAVQSVAFGILKRLFALCLNPKDKKLLIAFLSQEPFCYDEKKLLDIADFQEWANHVSSIVKLNKIFDEKGFGSFFQAFVDSAQEKIVNLADGRQHVRDLETLFDYLVVEKSSDLEGYYKKLILLESLLPQEQQKLACRFDPLENAVSVLTLHAAKGLEYDVVFALGLASRHSSDDEDSNEENAEALRLFYVAATRAKKRLYLPVAIDDDQKPAFPSAMELFLRVVDLKSLIARSNTMIAVEKIKMQPKAAPASQVTYQLQTKPHYIPSTQRRFFHSFSQRQEYKKGVSGDIKGGKRVGTLLHALLRTLIDSLAFSNDLLKKENCRIWLDEQLLGTHLEGQEEEISELLSDVFHVPIKHFTLADIDWKKVRSEQEFVYSDGADSYMRGVIDLVFEYEGIWYLLDWKSSILEEYSDASLAKHAIDSRYDLQASIYRTALLECIKPESYGGFVVFFLRAKKVLFL